MKTVFQNRLRHFFARDIFKKLNVPVGTGIDIIEVAILEAAAAPTFAAALVIGYKAFGRSACTEAAREGITAFKEKRPPDFGKTK